MGISRAGTALLVAVLSSPFLLAIFTELQKLLNMFFDGLAVSGNGQYAQSQESIRSGTNLAFTLFEIASSIETWILLAAFLGAVYAAVRSRGR